MKKIILHLVFICIVQTVFATHNRAGEILYKRVAPFTTTIAGVVSNVYNYSITVIRYTDDGMTVANRCADTVYFGDGTKSVLLRSNGSNTCNCQGAACGEIIVSTTGHLIKKSIYTIVHTYPGMGDYVIRSTDRNRNEDIVNIPNSINIGLYIEAYLVINAISGMNSSPVLNNPPIDLANNVSCFYHQPNASDADGDSLSYELIACKGSNGQPIVGYTYPAFTSGGYFFMGVNGLISWCLPASLGEYNIAFYVKEWRKNTSGVYQLIGMVERDMQVIVQAGVLGLDKTQTDETGFNFFPIPFDEKLNLESKENIKPNQIIKLFNAAGQLLFESKIGENKITIDTEDFAKGIYFLEIKNDEKCYYKKLVKG